MTVRRPGAPFGLRAARQACPDSRCTPRGRARDRAPVRRLRLGSPAFPHPRTSARCQRGDAFSKVPKRLALRDVLGHHRIVGFSSCDRVSEHDFEAFTCVRFAFGVRDLEQGIPGRGGRRAFKRQALGGIGARHHSKTDPCHRFEPRQRCGKAGTGAGEQRDGLIWAEERKQGRATRCRPGPVSDRACCRTGTRRCRLQSSAYGYTCAISSGRNSRMRFST